MGYSAYSLTWFPIWVGLGIAACLGPDTPYHLMPFLLSLVVTVTVSYALARWCEIQQDWRVALCLMVIGYGAASYRLESSSAPILSDAITTVVVGTVEAIEPKPKGFRFLLSDVASPRIDPENTPKKVRISTYQKTHDIHVGDRIRVFAKMIPPPSPHEKFSYDFSFYAYFKQIGAVGYALSSIRVLSTQKPGLLSEELEEHRHDIMKKLHDHLGEELGPVASAIVVGETHGINPTILDHMRISGLAHILSVSGMHLSMMAFIGFWLVRYLFCLSPAIALRYPIKQWAAFGGMVLSGYYLLISGMQVAALRAWLMVFVVLVAVILDRRILSYPCLAMAALVILLAQPESLFHPSFQMSFAAVLALIRLAQWQKEKALLSVRSPYIWERALDYIRNMCLASLIASLATMPFALYHFQQQAIYSVLANLLVLPAISLLVMPMMIVSLVLFPVGWEGPFAGMMGWGLEWMVHVAAWISHLPWAQFKTGFMHPSILILTVVSLLMMTIGTVRLRYLGIWSFIGAHTYVVITNII